MSILLSILGTTAIAASTIAAPIASNQYQTTQKNDNSNRIGAIKIENGFVESEVTGYAGSNTNEKADTQLLKISIPWTDLGISQADYFNIDWSSSQLALGITLSYANNVWANELKPRVIKKADLFSGENNDLGMFFAKTIYHDDFAEIDGFGRKTFHSWDYTLSDSIFTLEINARVWTIATDKLAWSYASISFDTLFYQINM